MAKSKLWLLSHMCFSCIFFMLPVAALYHHRVKKQKVILSTEKYPEGKGWLRAGYLQSGEASPTPAFTPAILNFLG